MLSRKVEASKHEPVMALPVQLPSGHLVCVCSSTQLDRAIPGGAVAATAVEPAAANNPGRQYPASAHPCTAASPQVHGADEGADDIDELLGLSDYLPAAPLEQTTSLTLTSYGSDAVPCVSSADAAALPAIATAHKLKGMRADGKARQEGGGLGRGFKALLRRCGISSAPPGGLDYLAQLPPAYHRHRKGILKQASIQSLEIASSLTSSPFNQAGSGVRKGSRRIHFQFDGEEASHNSAPAQLARPVLVSSNKVVPCGSSNPASQRPYPHQQQQHEEVARCRAHGSAFSLAAWWRRNFTYRHMPMW